MFGMLGYWDVGDIDMFGDRGYWDIGDIWILGGYWGCWVYL